MHLALPFDLLTAETGLQELPPAAQQPIAPFATGALDRLAALLHEAQRPLVLAGPSAARWHGRACRQLEEAQDLRVIPMESPRGLKDPSLGALAAVIPDADLIVLAGKCLDFTLGFGGAAALGGQARVVVIDPDAAMLERAQRLLGERLALAVQGEAIAALSALRAAQSAARAAWRARVDEALRYRGKPEPAASARRWDRAPCARRCRRFWRPRRIRCWSAMAASSGSGRRPIAARRCASSTACRGHWRGPVLRPRGQDRAARGDGAGPDGDGTAGFHLMELDTAVREQAPVIAVIGNDLRWNAEHLIQLRSYGPQRLIGCELSPTARYDEVASALGGAGFAADDAQSLGAALARAADSGLPACINVSMAGEAAPVFNASGPSAGGH